MKEQELDMKKKLTLYAQKFDEFQATLAKSNEIYVRFKNEMDNMTEKMKKVEKEANLWKSRFENCNKTLIDMIEERTEKGREYDRFVLKIQKLEKLCHALQEERKGLYDKIREVRLANAGISSKLSDLSENSDVSDQAPAVPDLEGLQELQEEDPVLMSSIARLREEQAKLQEFAASLLATPEGNEENEETNEPDAEDDVVVSAIVQFKTKTEVKQGPVPVPDRVEEKVQDPSVVLLEAPEPTDPVASPEVGQAQTQVQVGEAHQAERDEHVQQSEAPTPEPAKVDPEPATVDPEPATVDPEPATVDPEPAMVDPEPATVDPEPEALKTESLEETSEVKPVLPVEDVQVSGPEPVPGRYTQPSEGSTKPAASSTKQVLKKRKKKNSKSSS